MNALRLLFEINFPFSVHNTIGIEIPDPTRLTSQANKL